jgi:hypothetical protein
MNDITINEVAMALPMNPLPPNHPELERLLEVARNAPPMTPAELRAQRISWAYGNCAIDNPRITKEMVERIHDEMYGAPKDVPSR